MGERNGEDDRVLHCTYCTYIQWYRYSSAVRAHSLRKTYIGYNMKELEAIIT
jgi:hypothetical protein